MAPKVDTRKKLRETMDRLALATAEQLELLPAQKFDEKLAGFATLTKYITAVNREPDAPEGGDLGEFRKRLDRFSVVRGGGAGGDVDGDSDDTADDTDTGRAENADGDDGDGIDEPEPGTRAPGADDEPAAA